MLPTCPDALKGLYDPASIRRTAPPCHAASVATRASLRSIELKIILGVPFPGRDAADFTNGIRSIGRIAECAITRRRTIEDNLPLAIYELVDNTTTAIHYRIKGVPSIGVGLELRPTRIQIRRPFRDLGKWRGWGELGH